MPAREQGVKSASRAVAGEAQEYVLEEAADDLMAEAMA